MIEIQDSSQKLDESGAWEFDKGERGFWLTVPTVHGYALVYVYIHPDDPSHDMTVLRFVTGGRLYTRHIFGKAYSKRHCVTLAKRFAKGE